MQNKNNGAAAESSTGRISTAN